MQIFFSVITYLSYISDNAVLQRFFSCNTSYREAIILVEFPILFGPIQILFISLQHYEYFCRLLRFRSLFIANICSSKYQLNTVNAKCESHISTSYNRIYSIRGSGDRRNVQSHLCSLKSRLNDDDNVDDGYLSARVSSFV